MAFPGRKSVLLCLIALVCSFRISNAQESHAFAAQKPEEASQQRQLQETVTVPFAIEWQISIGNGGTDRQPTAEEYEWVVEATENWFTDNINEEYGSVEGLDLSSVDCTLDADKTTWDPNATPFPHSIFMTCQATFSATSVALVPSNVDLLVTLNDNYPVRDFIVDYLLTTGTDSIFHFSQRVSYITNSDPTGTPPGTPTNPPAPTTAAATPAPQPTPAFTNAWVIPFTIAFNLGHGADFPDRQPTEAEYEGLQVAAQQWLLDSLRAAYADETTFFVEDVLSSIFSTSWDPQAANNLPHSIVLDAYAIYNANAFADIPTLTEFFATLRSDIDLLTFLTDYLRVAQPQDSIFRSVTNGSQGSTQNGPILAVGDTPAPGSPPTTRAPSPAPARATPAPFNPSNIIYTQPTESNWTYTIGGDFGVEDRQPTQEEYEGLVESTHEWLTRIFNDYYNVNNQDQNLPQFVGVETALVEGIYQPGIADTPPHLVIINFNITYALDENDETQVVPFIDEIFDVIEEADLNQYVFLYVHTSEPIESSVFHGVNSVNWAYSVEDYTYVPRPTEPPSQNQIPGEGEPGDTGVARSDFENAEWVPVSLEYRYRLNSPDAHGAPTEAEWEGLNEATRNFWIETMTAEYADDPNADFVIVDAKWQVDNTTYDATQDFPYVGRMLTDILFTEGSTIPNSVNMRSQMSNAIPGSNLIGTYIRNAMPVGSLFRDTLEIQWDF